jgi:hypothetical protein
LPTALWQVIENLTLICAGAAVVEGFVVCPLEVVSPVVLSAPPADVLSAAVVLSPAEVDSDGSVVLSACCVIEFVSVGFSILALCA